MYCDLCNQDKEGIFHVDNEDNSYLCDDCFNGLDENDENSAITIDKEKWTSFTA